jgi:hypothetical protein
MFQFHEKPPYDSVPVRESWFEAFVLANRLYPQRGLGLNVFVLEAILRDRPESLFLFTRSRLLQEQSDAVAQAMAHMHARHGVLVATPDTKRAFPDPTVVQETLYTRLHVLWDGVRDGVTEILAGYRLQVMSVDDPEVETLEDEAAMLFDDPKYHERLRELQRMIVVAKAILLSTEMKELVREYRQLFLDQKAGLIESESAGWQKSIVAKKMTDAFSSRMQEQLPEIDPDVLAFVVEALDRV